MSDSDTPSPSPDETLSLGLSGSVTLPGGGPPEQIGAYRLEGTLGRGGMGEVFLAWDSLLERRVAIKRIRRDAPLTANQRERFRREARAAARLSHPSIVQVYGLIADGSGDSIVMEYVEGSTLAAQLAAGPLDLRVALRLAREIAEGLAAAHAAGLIHRDLKAENVILSPAGHAKILDFGLARTLTAPPDEETLTHQGVILGTFHSMSPEQARGEELDERSDLFSLGSLLYQMLTGAAPFRGEDRLDTVKRVKSHHPPPIAAVRGDFPLEGAALVDRLLAKSRDDRPRSAEEVVQALRGLETQLTGSLRAASGGAPVRPRRRRAAVLGGAMLAVAALGTAFWAGHRPGPPLRIAVLRPSVSDPADPRLSLAASGVLSATLAGLTSLEGLAPIEPSQIPRSEGSPAEIARAGAADEVVLASVEPAGELALVSFRRMARDGRLLWTGTLQIRTSPTDLYLLADAVAATLRKAYPGHGLRPGTPDLDVRGEDYAAFLAVKRDRDAGRTDLAAEAARLDEVIRSSPRFLEALLLAARIDLSLHQSTRDPLYLDRARRLVQQARALAPGDPRPLLQSFHCDVAGDRLREAEDSLAHLDRLLPGDAQILVLQAKLAEKQGRLSDTRKLLQTAVRLAPTWQNLHSLAEVEAGSGNVKEARSLLQTILQQDPDNRWAWEAEAWVEILYGDPGTARGIFERFARSAPDRYTLTNLGLAYFLLGDPGAAAAAYRRALEIDPGHILPLQNLADVEAEVGHQAEAGLLCRRVLSHFEELPDGARIPPTDEIVQAICLARLGRSREAVEATQEALRYGAGDPQILHAASLACLLAGERASALNYAQAALEKGLQPRWFSAYRALREDPEIRALAASVRPPRDR